MASNSRTSDFFISYNSDDVAWAEWIAWQLESAGYSVIVQAWDFGAGSNFVAEMHDGLMRAQRVLAVLSDQYLKSSFAFSEWASAFGHDPKGASRRLVPVRVDDCTPKGLLSQFVYIDLIEKDEALARKTLLRGVKQGRAKPASAPIFPGAERTTIPPRFPSPGHSRRAVRIENDDQRQARYQVDIGDNNQNIVIGENITQVKRHLDS